MRTIILASLAFLLIPQAVHADTAVEAADLPTDQVMKALAVSTVKLTAAQRTLLLGFCEIPAPAAIDLSEKQKAEIKTLEKQLADPKAEVPLRGVCFLLAAADSAELSSKLAGHDDPLLRLMANLQLAKSGDSRGGDAVFMLIHSSEPTKLQKQLIKAWCKGVGIRVESDTAESISSFLSTGVEGVQKWKPGDAAPDFKATDATGKEISLKQLAGKVVVLHFWSTWCGVCMANMNATIAELNSYPADRVVVVGISLDDEQEAFATAVKQHELPWINIRDSGGWGGDLARAYGVKSLPFDVVIDGQGVVRSNEIKDVKRLLDPGAANQ